MPTSLPPALLENESNPVATTNEPSKLNLCYKCVGEPFLKAEMQKMGKRKKCSYCSKTAKCYEIEFLSDRIERVFDEHFVRTASEPDGFEYALMKDPETSYDWEREGEPTIYAIMNAADIPEQVARDIQEILAEKFGDYDDYLAEGETEFSSEAYYTEKRSDGAFWQSEWRKFELSLKTRARFFNQPAMEHLTSIFEGIDTMHTRAGRPILIDAGPETPIVSFYRARALQSDDKLASAIEFPDKHIGPPPSNLAHGGRMNAHGISVFYGADDPLVALAEVRPPVGSQVVVARFEIMRSLRLLDLTALSEVAVTGSLFDAAYGKKYERILFLKWLSSRMIIPVMPDDEAREYLITQAIADFFASGTDVPIDGILFPSVQAAGTFKNVVLFHKAARVEALDLPTGTAVSSRFGYHDEDGWVVEYSVSEEMPPGAPRPVDGIDPLRDYDIRGFSSDRDLEERPITLKIDLYSVQVHLVKAVAFTTDAYDVRRHRWTKQDLGF